MAKRALIRGGVAALAAIGLTASFGPGTAGTALAANLPAGGRLTSFPTALPWAADAHVVHAGTGGFLRQSADGKHEFWTAYADGSSTEVPAVTGSWVTQNHLALGSDVLATLDATVSPELHLRDMRDPGAGTGPAAESAIDIPDGQRFLTMAGSLAVTASGDRTAGTWQVHLLRATAQGTTADTTVDLSADLAKRVTVQGGDDQGVILAYQSASGQPVQLAYADAATGAFHPVSDAHTGAVTPTFLLTPTRLAWYGPAGSVFSVSRDDPAGPQTAAALPARPEFTVRSVALVGTSVLVSDTASASPPADTSSAWGVPVLAVPLTGGTPETVLTRSTGHLRATGDGRAVIEGGTGSDDWGVRVLAADGGSTAAPGAGTGPVGAGTTVLPMAPTSPRIDGMTMDSGVVRYASAATSYDGTVRRNLFGQELGLTDGLPTGPADSLGAVAATAVPCRTGSTCLRLVGGSWALGYLAGSSDGTHDSVSGHTTPSKGGRVVDGWGPFIVYAGGSPSRLYVFDFNSSEGTPVDQPAAAATVRGGVLWRSTAKAGVLTADVIREFGYGPKRTVVTDATCVPTELQSAGRWLYWSCGPNGAAGAYDLTAKKNVALPRGTALLGDGYLVRHVGGHLVLNDFHTGTAGPDQQVADLPASSAADDRGEHWTVDRFGGGVAWADGTDTVRVLRTGVPSSPLENVGASDFDWFPSKPVSSWKVDYVRVSTKARVATRSYGVARDYYLASIWDERTDSGAAVPNGPYWSDVTALPADGYGAALTFRDSNEYVQDGAPVPHDFDQDGNPDLFLVGADTVLQGTSKGDFTWTYVSATAGWGKGALLVPSGDLDSDHRDDLLIRTSSGELRRYPGRDDGTFPDIKKPSVRVGTGWQIYTSLVSPGDLKKDGVPDLVARDKAGVLWRYDGTGRGGFTGRVRIGTGWNAFTKLVAADDLTGDGVADLLARDKAGVLWRYDGTGRGGFAPRVRIGTGWQIYTDLVGIGDLSVDGRNDLLARDAAGQLWLYAGTGRGSFAGRRKVDGGWEGVSAVY